MSELLNRRKPDADVRVLGQSPVITSTVKSKQNVTNINITSQSTGILKPGDMQVFQKGPQMTALISSNRTDPSRESVSNLPVRSRSSLSNVSSTHIPAPSSKSSEAHSSCQKPHRHKHHRGSRNSLQLQGGGGPLEHGCGKHHRHHHHKDWDYNSETNSAEPKGKTVGGDDAVMEQNYKRAAKIVQDLTKGKEPSTYEKHKQKCLLASDKYNNDLLKHYNARKSTSVLDFRSEVQIRPKYDRDAKSTEAVDDDPDVEVHRRRLYKKLDARSVKSLDFDSDCNQKHAAAHKQTDYASDPADGSKKPAGQGDKPKPPKKPVRLSLHRAQSAQSVEAPSATPRSSPTKQGHHRRGEVPPVSILTVSVEKSPERCYQRNGYARIGNLVRERGHVDLNWGGHRRESHVRVVESGSWC